MAQVAEQRRSTDEFLRQRKLFENAPGFIAVLRGPNHVFEFVNDAYVRVTGAHHYLGCPLRDVIPDGESQGLVELLDTVYRTGTGHVAQHRRTLLRSRPDAPAEEHFLDFVCEPILDAAGRPAAIFVEGFDVTACVKAEEALRQLQLTAATLARAESRLRAVFETTYLFQAFLTPHGTVLDCNRTALAAIERTLDQVVGMPFWEMPWFTRSPGVPERIERGVAAAAAGELMREELQLDMPVGGRRWFDFSLRPVRDREGAVIAIVPEALDVTERKAAEAALHQSQKLEAMGQLTGGVAHDFNNLLLPIVAGLDMLQRRQVGGEREQRLIGNALQSAERAKVLVQRLLAFARRQPLQPVAVDVALLIRDLSDLIASTLGPGITLSLVSEDRLPAAKADPNQLEMALLNLAVNSRDAMPDGGRLDVSATCHHVGSEHPAGVTPGRYICIAVADSGLGMDAATLARAVEPFFSTKGIGRGTGLGLSMVHGLALQLGGALIISSAPRLGTTVELWLPVSGSRIGATPGRQEAPPAMRMSGTALLVDDEEMIRTSTADMLSELGFVVIEAATAHEALAVLGGGRPIDVLVTDHLMPGMTGVELARRVGTQHAGLPVLVISGFSEVDGLSTDIPRLAKPFRQADLARALKDLTARPRR